MPIKLMSNLIEAASVYKKDVYPVCDNNLELISGLLLNGKAKIKLFILILMKGL
jgi:hypothetical protein